MQYGEAAILPQTLLPDPNKNQSFNLTPVKLKHNLQLYTCKYNKRRSQMNTNGEARWHDPKRYLWSLGLLVPLFPIFGAIVFMQTGQIWGWWLTPVIVYFIIPALDFFIGTDHSNPPESA